MTGIIAVFRSLTAANVRIALEPPLPDTTGAQAVFTSQIP